MEAIFSVIAAFLREQHEVLLVTLFSGGFFYFSRHWLKREIFKEKTMMSIIVSMTFAMANAMMVPIAYYTNESLTAFYKNSGFPSISPDTWIGWPLWSLLLISLLLHDLVEYWTHRFMHTKWLWPIHAIHHSDPDVNGFTAYRVHILQAIFAMGMLAFFTPWLGMPKEISAMTGLFIILLNAYVHLDVDWHHGRFRFLLSSPRFHRWHHADTPELYGKNIANMFPFYDVLFGTYCIPGPCHEKMGAVGVPENNFIKLMFYPLIQTAKMVRIELAAKRAQRHLHKAEITPAE